MRRKILISISAVFILIVLFLFTPAILGIFIHDEPLQDDSDLQSISAETSGKTSAIEALRAINVACSPMSDLKDPNAREVMDTASDLLIKNGSVNWEFLKAVDPQKFSELLLAKLDETGACILAFNKLITTPNLRWPADKSVIDPTKNKADDFMEQAPFHLMDIVRLANLDAVFLAGEDRLPEAITEVQNLIQLGTWMTESPETGVFARMIGIAIYDESVETLRLLTSHPNADPDTVCRWASDLGSVSKMKIDALSSGLKDEFRRNKQVLQQLFSPLQRSELGWRAYLPRAMHFYYHPNTTLNHIAASYRMAIQILGKPAPCDDFKQLNEDKEKREALSDNLIVLLLTSNAIGKAAGPTFTNHNNSHIQRTLCEPSLGDIPINQAAMAIFAYQHRTSNWPATLDEATQGCLTAPLASTLAGNTIGYSPEEKMVYEQNATGKRAVDMNDNVVNLSLPGPKVTDLLPPTPVSCEAEDFKKPASMLARQVSDEKMKEVPDPEVLYLTIRAVPNFAGGKLCGMKVLSFKPGSFFEAIGLALGDIVFEVDGKEMDVKQGFGGFGELIKNRKGTLKILRDGNPILIQIN